MSGIYIPGLAMPTNCLDCPVYWDKCPNFETEGEEYLERIHPDCPLVPVPEHGDLIERSAVGLTDFEIVMCDGNFREGMKMLLEKLENAPTIIPAEEGE